MKILVTGGAGFIGSHSVDELVKHGHEVWILDNMDPQVHGEASKAPDFKPDYLNQDIPIIRGDIRDREAVLKAAEGAEAILHLAARVGVGQSMYQIAEYMSVNTIGTSVLMEIIAELKSKPRKIVVASSMSIYGEGATQCEGCGNSEVAERKTSDLANGLWEPVCSECGMPLKTVPTPETRLLKPTSPYAIGKQDQEQLVLAMCRAYNIKALAMRYFNVYGDRQALSNPYTGVGAIFSSRLLNKKAPVIFEDGEQTRDFIHVSDVARANRLALESEATDKPLNIGTGNPVTIAQIARELASHLNLDIEPEICGQFRAGDIRHCIADTRLAEEAINFKAEKSFSEGIPELVAWVREQKAEDLHHQAAEELKKRGLTT